MVEHNTINLAQAGIIDPVSFNRMGMRMVEYSLFDAKAHFKNPTKKTKEKLAFISGTGMKIIMETFNIGYDHQRLCEAFFDYFNANT